MIQTLYKVLEMITNSMLEEGLQTNTVQSFKGHKNMSKYVFGRIIYSICNDVFFAAPKLLAA